MDPFVGELRLMPYLGNFITRGWLPCNGQVLLINQYTALFSLLRNTYGGNGTTTFALPNLNGRVVMGANASYPQGMTTGVETVTLEYAQMPAHTHDLAGSVPVNNVPNSATAASPRGNYFGPESAEAFGTPSGSGNTAPMLSGTTQAVGENLAHENRMPYLALNYFIAITGEYPQHQ